MLSVSLGLYSLLWIFINSLHSLLMHTINSVLINIHLYTFLHKIYTLEIFNLLLLLLPNCCLIQLFSNESSIFTKYPPISLHLLYKIIYFDKHEFILWNVFFSHITNMNKSTTLFRDKKQLDRGKGVT